MPEICILKFQSTGMYFTKATALINRIRNSENTVMHSAKIWPPLPFAELESLASMYNIPADIISFYREMNGFQLSYTFIDNTDFDKKDFGTYAEAFPPMWPNEHYWHLDGCINILPVQLVFGSDWKDYVWFDTDGDYIREYRSEQISSREFDRQVKPIDVFCKEEIAAALCRNGKADILLGSDHNASFTDYEPISFSTYFEGLCHTEGRTDDRREIFTRL